MTNTGGEKGQERRRLAEERLRRMEAAAPGELSAKAVDELVHELRVHQIELEMQNDELRRSQHELEVLQARTFDLYNLAPVGYLTLSDQGIVEAANLTCATLLGVTKKELVHHPFSRFISSEDQDVFYLHCRQLIEKKVAHDCELRMVRPDGSRFWGALRSIPAREDEESTGFRLVLHDCSRRKEAEVEARTVKEQWEKTFDAMDDVVAIHDQDRRVIRANKAAAALLGLAPAGLAGKYCYEVLGEEQPCPGCPEVLTRLTATPYRANIHNKHRDKTYAVASYPMDREEGKVSFVCVARDITESLQMERRLRQLHKMEAIGVLAGGIAHDFNNILFPVLGYAELAELRAPAEDSELSSYLQKIVQAALRAKKMTSQILSFSRQVPTEQYPFRPHLVVKEALALLRNSLPASIVMETEIASDCGTILADPTQYYQVVMNLCSNAYQAMEEKGGVLRVGLKKVMIDKEDPLAVESGLAAGEYIDLEVGDTGCGIAPETMERIFDPYFTTKGKEKGTGVGLSVVDNIVKSCRGRITVMSEPGKGTCFHVYLPRGAEKPAEEKTELPPAPASGSERILVVDDETMITGLFQAVLKRFGYQSIIFNSSVEALDFIKKKPNAFDLLITDMTMPQMNGLELSRKALAVRPDLPIMLCTGYSEMINDEQAQATGIAAGIKAFMLKPLALDNLLSTLRKLLDKKVED